jgi:hypothetical protein
MPRGKLLSVILIGLIFIMFISACKTDAVTIAPVATTSTLEMTSTKTTEPTETKTQNEAESKVPEALTPTEVVTPTPYVRLDPEDWQNWPVIPSLSPEMIEVYKRGQALGRDPHVFSVIGDCQSTPTYFLSIYDEGRYTLPDDKAYLQETIDWYAGSFSHLSITVKNGMTAPGVLNPMWRDIQLCESKETPITCEVRVSNPSLVLISLGTNWMPDTPHEQYVHYLSEIVRILLSNGVIPVLSTKADNIEGDYSRNLAMAEVAYEFSLPLWNFWAAVKDLPNRGLDNSREDVYLVHDGWDIRNQSALELLDHLHKQLLELED